MRIIVLRLWVGSGSGSSPKYYDESGSRSIDVNGPARRILRYNRRKVSKISYSQNVTKKLVLGRIFLEARYKESPLSSNMCNFSTHFVSFYSGDISPFLDDSWYSWVDVSLQQTCLEHAQKTYSSEIIT